MIPELDLVQEEDQITHLLSLGDDFDGEEILSESTAVRQLVLSVCVCVCVYASAAEEVDSQIVFLHL